MIVNKRLTKWMQSNYSHVEEFFPVPDWSALAKRLRITFKDPSLLQQAFIHRSYLNENPDFPLSSNERLEFLGDAVLGIVVAEGVYRLGTLDEGEMTRLRAALVRNENLARAASLLQLGEYLYLGQGEEKSGGRERPRNLVCALEAVVGAIFVDRGFAAARRFVWRLLGGQLEKLVEEGISVDHKSRLQEAVQAQGKGTPRYQVVQMTGPDHDREFTVEVMVGKEILGRGSGKSKQLAEKEAARQALQELSCS